MVGPHTGVVTSVVGAALVVVGFVRYVVPGLPPTSFDPVATGLLVVLAGICLVATGVVTYRREREDRVLGATRLLGVLTLGIAVLVPGSLEFGGVFWLGLLFAAGIAAGCYRIYRPTGTGDSSSAGD